MYILYGGGVTRSLGPQMILEEAGLPYELRSLDEHAGEHRQTSYLAINPAGVMPALKTIEETDYDEWRRVMAVNMDGVFLGVKHGIGAMKARGGGMSAFRSYMWMDQAALVKEGEAVQRLKDQGNGLGCRHSTPTSCHQLIDASPWAKLHHQIDHAPQGPLLVEADAVLVTGQLAGHANLAQKEVAGLRAVGHPRKHELDRGRRVVAHAARLEHRPHAAPAKLAAELVAFDLQRLRPGDGLGDQLVG